MVFARKTASLILVLALIVPVLPLAPSMGVSSAATQQATQQLPRVALVRLWGVSHTAYMAKFVGEKYVVVFESHGDVSLDGRYISSWKTAWVYKVDTGELLGTLTPDGDGYGDTWEVTSWEPFQATKVWDASGFFSADSKRMVEDVRHSGTNAHVVDTTSWTTIPIDWGFTDTDGHNFYATQLDYTGSTLFVGHIGDGTIYVYKYDVTQGKYVLAFSHQESGNYGRRAQITLDGKYIMVGGLDYGYLDIWEWSDGNKTYTRVVHYQLPDSGGLGGLGISDPYNVGYIISGTKNGWVIIAHFNTTTKEFKVIYQNKEAPDDSWIYNPFYERWIPKVTEVFALCSHRDSGRPGYGIVYDVLTNQTIVIHFADSGSPQWSAAAVSPEANYVFLGNSLYMVVKRDIESGKPRVRFWGHMTFIRGMHHLGSPIVFSAPARDWSLYFQSGRITISRIYTESIPVTLTDDPDILHGRLGKLYNKGLINAVKVVENSGSVDKLELGTVSIPEAGFDAEHTVEMATLYNVKALYGWNGHGFGGATVSSATVIDVPFKAPMDIYSEVKLDQSIAIVTVAPVFDWKKEILGIFGLEFLAGGVSTAAGKALATKAVKDAIEKAVAWHVVEKYAGTEELVSKGIQALRTAKAATKAGSKALGILGIALIVDAGVGVYAHYVTYSSVRTFIAVMPVVEDPAGNKYGAVVLVLPMEEIQKAGSEYEEHIRSIAQQYGLVDVGIQFIVWGDTWDDYKALLEAGKLPTIDLKSAIETTIASKYGYSTNDLKIVGAKIVIETLVHGKTNLWDWVTGGVKVPVVTIASGSSIIPKAVTAGGRIYTDPATIADLLEKVTINGKEYELTAGADGAYADFQIQLGADSLSIDFGKRQGYFADIRIDSDVVVVKDFQPLEDFGYTATLHYDWNDTLIRIERIGFIDMPYPMYMAERTFIYKYGNFTNDITDAFELSQVIDSDTSPTGKLYYYITRENTLYIDPANGGIMMPCKTYVFNYFYKEPPDVGIKVYLNGTSITSTLAHHATVVINSSAEQDVEYTLETSVKYFEGMTEKTLVANSTHTAIHVEANKTAYRIYDITPYVDAAIEFMRTQKKPAFVEITARITRAEYDFYKTNNEYRVVYYPPPTLPQPLPSGPFNVTVKVYEYVLENSSWIPSANAKVEVYYGALEESNLNYTATTDENGEAKFVLDGGTWTFKAYKEGFLEAVLTAPIYNDTAIQLYLAPVPQPPPENETHVSENVTVVFKVYDATNGSAILGANITAVLIEPENSTFYGAIFTATTGSDGEASLELPIGRYNITVNATSYKPFQTTLLFDKDTIANIPLVPEAINITEYAKLEVRVFYADGKPYEGAHAEIRNATDNSLIATLATDSFGNATLTLPKNHDYNITVKVYEPLYNRSYEDSVLVTLTEDTIVTFTVPWNSTHPPAIINETPYYWLTVQVVWANGLPFHGANITVYNYTSGEPIDSLVTNGTGTVHFLLPAFQEYLVLINATNPYNTTQNYTNTFLINLTDHRWITIKLPWLPEEPELAKNYRVLIHAYDATNGSGIPGVTVIMRKGDVAWASETNETGYAELWVPFLGLYNATGIHPDYQAVWRTIQIYENNTLVNLPLSPVPLNYTEVPPPPINGTEYPPIYINGTPYYWLSIQVLYNDGYPFHGANITVIDLETNTTIATGVTNGTGFVHFLIQANKTIKYTVDASNPELNETYHDEKTLNMTQHYYFVHRVPWTSKFYTPEVWMMRVRFEIHRGQGYFFGNVSHLVVLEIWTNKPQNVTVLIGLYNVTGGTWVSNETVEIPLEEGVNVVFEWVSVNASIGGLFKVFANITNWEADTNTSNNWAWSEEKYLKPMVDIQVFVLWRPIEQKQSWTLLPEDIIEVDIGINLPINTTHIPAKLTWQLEKYDLKGRRYSVERGSVEEIRSPSPGIVWRNITVVVPWTSKITIIANATHEWEDFGYNNYINVTIPIDPDVKITLVEYPTLVMEGQVFKVVVNITSNVEPGKGTGWVSLIDNTTETLIKRVQVTLEPEKTVEIEAKAPENPAALWFIRTPTTTHTIATTFAGYDVYTGNNADEFTLTVTSYQWLTIIAIIVVIIAILASIKAVTHTIHDIRNKKKKFVKRRTSFLTESIHELTEEYKYVKKKED